MRPLAIYIHWPFCKSKCPYCDFNSHVRDSVEHERWQAALLRELDTMAQKVPDHRVTSIFFGGGTPSLMKPATVESLIRRVHELWPVADNIEITLEANPTSVESSTFPDFKAAGINRVSLGVQSLDTEALRFLGREHSAHEALHAIDLARKNFDRYSFDLIYARPQQTLASWEAELTQAMAYVGGHLSLYQLTIEENTAFHHAYAKGGFTLPDEAESEALYRLTESLLADRGLLAYEVSNYAKSGEESRHNLSYWKGDDYVGVGPGAHGRISIPPSSPSFPRRRESSKAASAAKKVFVLAPQVRLDSRLRGNDESNTIRIATQTLKSPERWLENVEKNGHAMEVWEVIEPQREVEERVMMGLRLREGISYEDFHQQTGMDLHGYISPSRRNLYVSKGLLVDDPTRLQPTLSGRLVLNQLTAELLK